MRFAGYTARMSWKLAFTGVLALALFSFGTASVFGGAASLMGRITDDAAFAGALGALASVTFGALLAWPFLRGFRAVLREGQEKGGPGAPEGKGK